MAWWISAADPPRLAHQPCCEAGCDLRLNTGYLLCSARAESGGTCQNFKFSRGRPGAAAAAVVVSDEDAFSQVTTQTQPAAGAKLFVLLDSPSDPPNQ